MDTWELTKIENLISFIHEETSLGKIEGNTSEEILRVLEEFTY